MVSNYRTVYNDVSLNQEELMNNFAMDKFSTTEHLHEPRVTKHIKITYKDKIIYDYGNCYEVNFYLSLRTYECNYSKHGPYSNKCKINIIFISRRLSSLFL